MTDINSNTEVSILAIEDHNYIVNKTVTNITRRLLKPIFNVNKTRRKTNSGMY